MPNSTDNQDYGEKENKNDQAKVGGVEKSTGPALGNLPPTPKEDENNFTSDDQKGKKVDADLEEESDQPINQQ
jgi:hypothetical protein